MRNYERVAEQGTQRKRELSVLCGGENNEDIVRDMK